MKNPTFIHGILLVILTVVTLTATPGFKQRNEAAIYISTKQSVSRELVAYKKLVDANHSNQQIQTVFVPLIKELENFSKSDLKVFSLSFTRVSPPNPCPPSPPAQCLPLRGNKYICFYSERDERQIEVYLNSKLVGKTSDHSFDADTKIRTVSFEKEANIKEGDILRLDIPISYFDGGKKIRKKMSYTHKYL